MAVEYNPETMRFSSDTPPVKARTKTCLPLTKVCLYCGRVFTGRGLKFCSNDCKKAFFRTEEGRAIFSKAKTAEWANRNSVYNKKEFRAEKSRKTTMHHADPNSGFNKEGFNTKLRASLYTEECKLKRKIGLEAAHADPNSGFNTEDGKARKRQRETSEAYITICREARLQTDAYKRRKAKAKQLYTDGVVVTEIAKQIGVSKASVYNILSSSQHPPATKDTYIERAIESMLNEIRVIYIKQFRLDGRLYDFALSEYGILIECDGEYFHRTPEELENDKLKDEIARDNRYILLRFTGSQIDRNLDSCKEIILAQIQGVEPGQWQPKAIEYNPETMKFSISNN